MRPCLRRDGDPADHAAADQVIAHVPAWLWLVVAAVALYGGSLYWFCEVFLTISERQQIPAAIHEGRAWAWMKE
jgi:hypothetical protein